MNKQELQQAMKSTANHYGASFLVQGEDWQYCHETGSVICPTDWHIEDDTDRLWRKMVLEQSPDYDDVFAEIPMYIFNLYHELGHHENGNDYDEIALRKILDLLAPMNKELATLGYFELQSEKDASEWAIDTINQISWWWETY
jgi:hypothetical protein